MTPTLRRPLSFSTDLWLFALSEAFLAALSDAAFLQACGLRRARSDCFVVRPGPGVAPTAATCLAAPLGPTEPRPGRVPGAPHSSSPTSTQGALGQGPPPQTPGYVAPK